MSRLGIVASSRRRFDLLADIPWENLWWASDPDWSPPADGAAVSSWPGRGAKAGTMTQANPSLQPVFRSSVSRLAGRPAVEFDASNDVMIATVGAPTVADNRLTYLVVVDLLQTPTATRNVFGTGTAGSWHFVALASGPAWRIRFAGTARTGGTPAPNTAYLLVSTLNTAGSDQLVVNDSTVISGVNAGDSPHLTSVALGPDGSSASMRVALAAIFSGDLTAHPRWGDLRSWITSFYGL